MTEWKPLTELICTIRDFDLRAFENCYPEFNEEHLHIISLPNGNDLHVVDSDKVLCFLGLWSSISDSTEVEDESEE